MRKTMGLELNPYFRSVTAWTVMGDLNSICYRPYQDVVSVPLSLPSSSSFPQALTPYFN